MKHYCLLLAEHPGFQHFVTSMIILSAALLGFETFQVSMPYQHTIAVTQQIILGVFILEIVIKHIALSPEFIRFYRNPWNIFDFVVVALALIPASGQYALIARLLRLLRILRLISAWPELRLIVSTLVRSIPSMFHVVSLMGIIFYIYAVAGYYLFHEHDPEHWRHLGTAFLTLFRIVTLEDWTDVMYIAMESLPYAWIYFISFVVAGTFVIVNLFIAVVLNNLDNAKKEQQEKNLSAASITNVKQEIELARKALEKLHTRIMLYEIEQEDMTQRAVDPMQKKPKDSYSL